ncbi:hypothetical protein [Vibrio astriarenae]|uniref:hypothetical protein n=1 Tax=Vibrio astriarenae TaxID=1481923 RepID=UPI003736F8F2
MKLKFLSALIIASSSFFATASDQHYAFDTTATYTQLSSNEYLITLTAWTDKPWDYVHGNNEREIVYGGPYGLVNAGDCSVSLNGPEYYKLSENHYGWKFTDTVNTDQSCEIIDAIYHVEDQDGIYFDYKMNESGKFDVDMNYILRLKENATFYPERFITVMPWTSPVAGITDQYKISH